MRCLVTGGAGFIGAHLVRALVARADAVRILDNFSTGTAGNLRIALGREVTEPTAHAGVARYGAVEILRGDLRDAAACEQACDGVDAVLHLGAQPSVPRSVDDPRGAHDCNVTGTVNLLLAASRAGVRRFVYASSSSVYGDDPVLPNREEHLPAPVSPYAASKLAGEHYCQVFARTYGLATVSLRYFNVFGPLQAPQSSYAAVIPRFIAAALEARPLEIHGDGQQSRDFTHVENVVAANLQAIDGPDLGGEAVNVGGGERLTLLEVAEAVERLVGRGLERRHTEARRGDVRHTQADLTKARRVLGYVPIVPFAEGLARTVAFFTEQAARPVGPAR